MVLLKLLSFIINFNSMLRLTRGANEFYARFGKHKSTLILYLRVKTCRPQHVLGGGVADRMIYERNVYKLENNLNIILLLRANV